MDIDTDFETKGNQMDIDPDFETKSNQMEIVKDTPITMEINNDIQYEYIKVEDIFSRKLLLEQNELSKNHQNKLLIPDLRDLMESEQKYLETSDFIKVFNYLIYKFKDFYPNLCIVYSNKSIDDYFLQLNLNTSHFEISKQLHDSIYKCIQSKQLIIIPFGIILSHFKESYFEDDKQQSNTFDKFYGHANVIIIDNILKKIEYFEPHGILFTGQYINISIERLVHQFINDKFGLKYEIVNVSKNCPIGPQIKAEKSSDRTGYCLAWSLYTIYLRLLNFNYKPHNNDSVFESIIQFLNGYHGIDLDRIIRKFISYVTVLEYKDFIDNLNTMEIDIFKYLNDTEKKQIELRLEKLIQKYFKNSTKYKRSFHKILQEVISYKNLPNFSSVFTQTLDNLINPPLKRKKKVR